MHSTSCKHVSGHMIGIILCDYVVFHRAEISKVIFGKV